MSCCCTTNEAASDAEQMPAGAVDLLDITTTRTD